jgi:hypothetical protein
MSKMGGMPDLPADIDWPTREGAPLEFIAQIALDEIAMLENAADLPPHGMLSFFFGTGVAAYGSYDAAPGSWAVLWSSDLARCVRREAPTPSLFPERLFRFVEGFSLPTFESPVLQKLGLTMEHFRAYCDVHAMLFGDQGFELLGHGFGGQGALDIPIHLTAHNLELPKRHRRRFWETVTDAAIRERWRQLFAVPYMESQGYVYGHEGMLNFWIRDADLQARNFDKTVFNLEPW